MLFLLDRGWSKENAPRIFSAGEEQVELWRAAWNPYVIFCRAYRDVLELLREEYARAISRINGPTTEQRRPGNADTQLGAHLVSYLAQGQLSEREPAGLLAKFFAAAPEALRAHVMSSVGFDLYHATDVEPAVLKRFQDLWEWRLETMAIGVEAPKAEAATFGWWFASRKFDGEWSLQQLRRVLRLPVMVESHHLVAEHLAELVERYPAEVLDCFSLLVQNDREEWLTSAWREQARKILSFLIERTEGAPREAAIELVHRLGARGLFEFRDLLPRKSDQ